MEPGPAPMPLYAICYMVMNGIIGTFRFEQMDPSAPLKIMYDVTGLKSGNHGVHIHEFGDTRNNCMNAGAHLNPWQQPHGAPFDEYRHMGDLGNIMADNSTAARGVMETVGRAGPNLFFPTCIGRAVVIHEFPDDMGRGNNEESKKTGNAGSRLGCCTIALAKPESDQRSLPPPPPPRPHPMYPPPSSHEDHDSVEEHPDKK